MTNLGLFPEATPLIYNMHEIHAVENIIKIIKEKAKENNLSKISKINVALGALSGISKEDFTYWFCELSKNTPACEAEISFNEIPEPNVYLESIEA